MKRKFKIILILFLTILLVGVTNVYAETPTLEQIVNTFNNSGTTELYNAYGYDMTATSSENKITVTTNFDDVASSFDFLLSGTILSADADLNADDGFTKYLVWTMLVDSIGQLHGYKDGELMSTLNSAEADSYTIENQGYENKEISDNVYRLKVDISKKIPLVDFSDTYIEVSDLDDYKEIIADDGTVEMSKGNVWFNKSGNSEKNVILLAEKKALTKNAYRSLLSILTVMFDSKEAITYFEKNYPEIVPGTKEFAGIKIEVNPSKNDLESRLIPDDSEYDFARITIDKKKYTAAMVNNSGSSETVINVPNTDKNIGFKLMVYGCFLILIGSGTIFYILTRRTIKQEQ